MSNIRSVGEITQKCKSSLRPQAGRSEPTLKLLRRWRKELRTVRTRMDGVFVSLNGKKPERSIRATIRKKRGTPSASFSNQAIPKYRLKNVAEIETCGDSKTLLLDFDMARPIQRASKLLYCLRVIGLRARWMRYSRSAHGWHVEIGINVTLAPSEQVACQQALGSDPRREVMNLRRTISLRVHKHSRFWRKRWNLLFKVKI